MGVCLSARIKAESPCHTGTNAKSISAGRNDLSTGSKMSSSSTAPPTPRSEGEILWSSNLKSFAYSDLKIATRNFRPDSVLGEGGFGSVFKGWIDESSFAATKPGMGIVIAVKKLNQESFQGHREWLVSHVPPLTDSLFAIQLMGELAEVNYLGQLYHPHLVRLIGHCLEDVHQLLVYEFMPRGNLENHLFRRGSYFQPLSWSLRWKVALGAAKGLAFLHSSKVIYRDFKTSNVLLDSDGPSGDKSHVSTRVMGTYGYAAPEYLATCHLTARSDVYSFGVVLLEMLSGRRAVDKNRASGEHNLVDWAKPYLANKRKVFRAVDNRLEGQYTMEEAHKIATLALRCLSMDAKFRPNMDKVVTSLEEIQNAKETKSGHEKLVSSGQRVRRWSADDARIGARPLSYPRPSVSPLYVEARKDSSDFVKVLYRFPASARSCS